MSATSDAERRTHDLGAAAVATWRLGRGARSLVPSGAEAADAAATHSRLAARAAAGSLHGGCHAIAGAASCAIARAELPIVMSAAAIGTRRQAQRRIARQSSPNAAEGDGHRRQKRIVPCSPRLLPPPPPTS